MSRLLPHRRAIFPLALIRRALSRSTSHWQQIIPGNKWSTSRGEQRVQLKSSWETLTSYGPPRCRPISCLGLFIISLILDVYFACTQRRQHAIHAHSLASTRHVKTHKQSVANKRLKYIFRLKNSFL